MAMRETMSPVMLNLYVRQDCHLCEDMHAQLLELQSEYGFDLELRDVDCRSDWARAYGDKVPLLLSGDTEICRYFLDLKALRAQIVGNRDE